MKAKILFVNAPKSDYLQDWTYAGLAEILGKNHVYDYPLNYRYHLPLKEYPKNGGFVKGDLHKRLFSSFKDFDLVILASSHPECFEEYLKIIDKIPTSTPLVFIDGGDQSDIGGDLKRYDKLDLLSKVQKNRKFDLILKREYLIGTDYATHIHPYPFCINSHQIPKQLPTDKSYDVSFWAVESHSIRTSALEILENLYDCRQNGTQRKQVFKKYNRKGAFYLEELKRCKIVLNFRGGGWDTVRYWEVPAVASFMLTQKPGFLIPNDFICGQHVDYVREDLSNLKDLCDYYLKNEDEREEMAAAAHKHLMQYHTHLHRAHFLLEKTAALY